MSADQVRAEQAAAELTVVAALEDVPTWLNVTPIAIATRVVSAFTDAGWTLTPPKPDPMLCPKCGQRWKIAMRSRAPVGPPAPYHYCDCEGTDDRGAGEGGT